MLFHIVKAGYTPEAKATLCGLAYPAHQAIFSSNDVVVMRAHGNGELCADCWTDWQPQNAGAVAAKAAAMDADSALDGGSDTPEFTEALIRMRDAENAERNKTICPECGNRFAGDAYGRGCICPKPQMTIRRYSCAECEARPERCYQQGAEVPGIGLRLVYCGCKSPNCGDCVIPGPAKACVGCGMRMARTAIAIRRMRCAECYAAVKRGGYRGVAARDLTREAQERQMAGFTPDYAITTAEALGY